MHLGSLATVLLIGTCTAKNVVDGKAFNAVSDKVLSIPIQGQRSSAHPNPRYSDFLEKRATSASVTLTNQFTFYSVEVGLGTPEQKVQLLIDTGSSDLWAIASNNPFCATSQQELNSGNFIDCSQGTFDQNTSSTFHQNSTNFFIQYGDFTFAQGVWGTDTVQFGGVTVNGASIAVGEETNSSQGVFGIGFPGLESTDTGPGGVIYENIPELLVQQGDINGYGYSLYLNNLTAQSGTLLFGGVDHDKYQGTLGVVPIINILQGFSQPIQFNVALSSISVQNSQGKSSTIQSGNVPALLDSGTSLTYLLTDAVENIAAAFGAQMDGTVGLFVADCSVANQGGSVVYDFSGVSISVPLNELFLPLSDYGLSGSSNLCGLGILPVSDPSNIILGDTFLRSAYVVYDLENFQIALANTNFNAANSNVEALSSGIPSASTAASYSSTDLASNVQFNSASAGLFSVTGSGGAPAVETTISQGSVITITPGAPIPTRFSGIVSGATATSTSGKSAAGTLKAPTMQLVCLLALSVAIISLV